MAQTTASLTSSLQLIKHSGHNGFREQKGHEMAALGMWLELYGIELHIQSKNGLSDNYILDHLFFLSSCFTYQWLIADR